MKSYIPDQKTKVIQYRNYKHFRINHANFVTKELSNTILLKSKLRNKYLKKTDDARIRQKKNVMFVFFLLRKAK